MSRIKLIVGFEEERAKHALNLLLRDRRNEFKELSAELGISHVEEWEVIILKFCLDFEGCFKTWTNNEEPDHNQIHKCMTLMKQIAQGKKSITVVTNIQNTAYNIAKEFHEIYKRIK